QAIDAMLLIAFLEAGEEYLLLDFAVLAHLGIEDVRGAGDEDAILVREDAGGEADVVHEESHLVVGPVGFGLFEEFDLAAELVLAIDAERIVAHLDDPEFAVG